MNGTMKSAKMRERIIEDAIISRPEMLGFPGALSIRNWRVAPTCGRLDIGLLPVKGTKRLVLVEAKGAAAPDAAAKVVGQLLMYYAGALTLGAEGLRCLRLFAENTTTACDTSKKSIVRLSGGLSPTDAAWERLQSGRPLSPDQVSLFIALDDEPHLFLRSMLETLHERHKLSIGMLIVKQGVIGKVTPPRRRNNANHDESSDLPI
jgi:hypothetical protein